MTRDSCCALLHSLSRDGGVRTAALLELLRAEVATAPPAAASSAPQPPSAVGSAPAPLPLPELLITAGSSVSISKKLQGVVDDELLARLMGGGGGGGSMVGGSPAVPRVAALALLELLCEASSGAVDGTTAVDAGSSLINGGSGSAFLAGLEAEARRLRTLFAGAHAEVLEALADLGRQLPPVTSVSATMTPSSSSTNLSGGGAAAAAVRGAAAVGASSGNGDGRSLSAAAALAECARLRGIADGAASALIAVDDALRAAVSDLARIAAAYDAAAARVAAVRQAAAAQGSSGGGGANALDGERRRTAPLPKPAPPAAPVSAEAADAALRAAPIPAVSSHSAPRQLLGKYTAGELSFCFGSRCLALRCVRVQLLLVHVCLAVPPCAPWLITHNTCLTLSSSL